MKKGIFLKISSGLLILTICVILVIKFYAEPWLAGKIIAELENGNDLTTDVKKIDIDIFRSELDLKNVRIISNLKMKDYSGEIESVKFTGINIIKAVFKHEINIDEVVISRSKFRITTHFSGKPAEPGLSPLKIRVGRILFDQFSLNIENDSGGLNYSVKDGLLRIYGLQVSKMDSISPDIINFFDFEAGEFNMVSPDRMYLYSVRGIRYFATLNSLAIDSLSIIPKYKDYDFTSRFNYQKNRIEGCISKISVHDFYVDRFLKPMFLESSFVEIGEMNLNVFRDKRKSLSHEKKPSFQDMIYNIPSVLRIDSIILRNGRITYRVHGQKSKEPGILIINGIRATMLNLTNDNLYKSKKESLELKADAMIMGKGKLTIHLRGRIFDKNNTLSVKGSMSRMDVNELNPVLEKNASIYATGIIDAMNFNFVMDNDKARGKMNLLYHGLDITVRDKRSADTTSLRSRLFSLIANRRILDSNPEKGEKARIGIIDYERDPEKFLFHYCYRSILTGIGSTLTKNEKKNKNKLSEISVN